MNLTYRTLDTVLIHHGIIGQKWGVKNGPPYPLKEGQNGKSGTQYHGLFKKKDKETNTEKTAKEILSTKNKVNEFSDKYYKLMTNQELHDRITRLQLEKQFIDAKNAVTPKKGESYVKRLIKRAGKESVENVVKPIALYTVVNAMEHGKWNLNDAAKYIKHPKHENLTKKEIKEKQKQQKTSNDVNKKIDELIKAVGNIKINPDDWSGIDSKDII